MRPKAEDLGGSNFREDLVNKSVLYVDSAGVGSREIADKFLVGRRCLKRVLSKKL